jgi:hypothetical protein
MGHPAILFRDRLRADDWRVERIDDDGEFEVAIFLRPNASPLGQHDNLSCVSGGTKRAEPGRLPDAQRSGPQRAVDPDDAD